MGSYMNFKNFVDSPQLESNGGRSAPGGSFPLVRQSSIYSLTFDELQSTLGSAGKDFGSMNMEDLLKNIWTAEESQVIASSSGGGGNASIPGGNLQRQGSLTLPRTLSQKTVDEVWRDLFRENGGVPDGSGGGSTNLGPRQPTLGEMTLEEFLFRAGVVREDTQQTGTQNNSGYSGNFTQPTSTTAMSPGFQQSARNQGVPSNQIGGNSTGVLNVGGLKTSQLQQLQQQQPLFPKQATVAFAPPMQLANNTQQAGHTTQKLGNNALASPGSRGPVVGMSNASLATSVVQGGMIQNGAIGLAGIRAGATVAGGSPGNALSSEVTAKSNLESSLSPSPYAFSESGRGRRAGSSLEKVVERRRRRMIKNRESAARSRARKQAYTLELEAEVTKLKEINQELQKKQAEFMEMQKNQMMEKINAAWGGKRRCLRRTLTGPW